MYEKLKSIVIDINNKINSFNQSIFSKLLFVVLLIAVIISYFSMEKFSLYIIDGSINDFLGSFVGVLGAFLVANYQIRKEKEHTELKDKPRVLLGSEEYENIDLKPGYDIYNQKEPLTNWDSFSEMSIKVINVGNSPIYNIRVMYDFPNLDNYLDVYKKYSNDNQFFRFEKNLDKISFLLDQKGTLEDEVPSERYFMKENYITSEIPYLFSEQEQKLKLPSFYLYLLQYYFIMLPSGGITGDEEVKKPLVKAKLIYENYKLELEQKEFYIMHSYAEIQRSDSVNLTRLTIKPYREKQFEQILEK